LKRALKDGVKLIDSNRNLRFKISKIWSQLEAEKGENFTLQEYSERRQREAEQVELVIIA